MDEGIIIIVIFITNITFYFLAQLVRGSMIFTLSDLLDRPWSQVSCLPPPRYCMYVPYFLSRIGSIHVF